MQHERDQKIGLDIIHETGALIAGTHVVFTSGRHGSDYVHKDAIYVNAAATARMCRMLAKRFIFDEVETILAPAVGGALLAQWTSYYLEKLTGRTIASIYAERVERGIVMRLGQEWVISRGYDRYVSGKRVLVLEDVVNAGSTVRAMTELVRKHDGMLVGVGALCNRNSVTSRELIVPKLTAIVNMKLASWDEGSCPMCKLGTPINTSVGKGREYLEQKARS